MATVDELVIRIRADVDSFTAAAGRAATAARSLATQAQEAASTLARSFTSASSASERFAAAVAAAWQRAAAATRTAVQAVGARLQAYRTQLQMTAFQVQDILVGVTLGMPLERVLATQLPQLLGAFGALGAILGVAAGAAFGLASAFGTLGGRSRELQDLLDETAEAAAKNAAAFVQTATSAEILRRAVEELSEAQRQLLPIELMRQMVELRRQIDEETQAVLERAASLREAFADVPLGGLERLREMLQSFGVALPERLDTAVSGLEELARQVRTLDEQLRSGEISAADYARSLFDLRERIVEARQAVEELAAEAARSPRLRLAFLQGINLDALLEQLFELEKSALLLDQLERSLGRTQEAFDALTKGTEGAFRIEPVRAPFDPKVVRQIVEEARKAAEEVQKTAQLAVPRSRPEMPAAGVDLSALQREAEVRQLMNTLTRRAVELETRLRALREDVPEPVLMVEQTINMLREQGIELTQQEIDQLRQKAAAVAELSAQLERQQQTASIAQRIASGFAQAFTTIVTGARASASALDQLRQLAVGVLQQITQMIMQRAIVDPVTRLVEHFVGPFASGFFNWLFGGPVPETAPAATVSRPPGGPAQVHGARGLVLSVGRVTPFSRGGVVGGMADLPKEEIASLPRNAIVDKPILFPMRDGVGLAGEAGPEAIVPLVRSPDGFAVRAVTATGEATVPLTRIGGVLGIDLRGLEPRRFAAGGVLEGGWTQRIREAPAPPAAVAAPAVMRDAPERPVRLDVVVRVEGAADGVEVRERPASGGADRVLEVVIERQLQRLAETGRLDGVLRLYGGRPVTR